MPSDKPHAAAVRFATDARNLAIGPTLTAKRVTDGYDPLVKAARGLADEIDEVVRFLQIKYGYASQSLQSAQCEFRDALRLVVGEEAEHA